MAISISGPQLRRVAGFVTVVTMCCGAIVCPCASMAGEDTEVIPLSRDASNQYGRVQRSMADLNGFLQAVGFERPAIIGTNYFAVSVGGIDAIKDLEEGRGVDPETFAGLYAGFALPAVAEHLNARPVPGGGIKITSPDGRLRYKGTAIRLYSPARLRSLFEQRSRFHHEDDRKQREAFTEFVFARKRDVGQLDRIGDDSEIAELGTRFRNLQPLLGELETALRSERAVSSILQGETSQHFFAYSVGGIDVLEDLRTRHAVDPETLAAIYAQKISTDYAADFTVNEDGEVLYDGTPIKLYSVKHLESCFRVRDRLASQGGLR